MYTATKNMMVKGKKVMAGSVVEDLTDVDRQYLLLTKAIIEVDDLPVIENREKTVKVKTRARRNSK